MALGRRSCGLTLAGIGRRPGLLGRLALIGILQRAAQAATSQHHCRKGEANRNNLRFS